MLRVTISYCVMIGAIFVCLTDMAFAFNMEELKHINYEVDISGIPVKREETNSPTVLITSKSGQEFQCQLPQLNDEEISEKEHVNEKDVDVTELLMPMKVGTCLYKSKDWWTFEFCYGLYIKQFHIEDAQVIGQIITLGRYESDFDWKNETLLEKFKPTKQRYHSQFYTNGSKCDLTGQPRTAEVRFYCEEDAGDYIHRVDEPGTCSYTIIVHTSRLCSHPLLKPLASKKAHAIQCHPLLDDEQYSNYLQQLKEERALAEESRRKWLETQQKRLEKLKKENIPEDEQKVKVHILTTDYYNNGNKKDTQSSTDEETDSFENMIMSVLSGQQEAVQELRRRQILEENYSYAWEENEEEEDYKED